MGTLAVKLDHDGAVRPFFLSCIEKMLFAPVSFFVWKYGDMVFSKGLARGLESVLYRAKVDGRPVVVKTLPVAAVRKGVVNCSHLEQEYRVGRKLHGIEGVPAHIDLKELRFPNSYMPPSLPLLILEPVPGLRLDSLPWGPDEYGEMLVLFRSLAKTVAAVHEAGVVHKDINPANILVQLGEGGKRLEKVWLIDFGASVRGSRFSQQFGAPEQHIPVAFGDVTRLSDIFSLGLVMYYQLEGKLPYSAEHAAQVLIGKEELALEFSRTQHKRVRRLLEAMLRKDPEDRPASMDIVETELARISHELCW